MTKKPSIVSQFFQKRQIISDIEKGLITDVFDLPDFAKKSIPVAQAFFTSPLTQGGDFEEFSLSVQSNSKIISLAMAKDLTVLLTIDKSENDSSWTEWINLCATFDDDLICNGLIKVGDELASITESRDLSNLDSIISPSLRESDLKESISLLLLSKTLSSRPKIAKVILERWPERYTNMSDIIKDDEDFTKLVISQKGHLMQKASPRLRQRVDLWQIALNQDEYALTNFKTVNGAEEQQLLNSKETFIPLLEINGDLLKNTTNPELQDDMDVVKTAIQQDPFAFQYASERLKNDKELQWFIFSQIPQAIHCFFDQVFDIKDNQRLIEFSQVVKSKSSTEQETLIKAYACFDNYVFNMNKKADKGSELWFDCYKLGADLILSNLTEDSLKNITTLKSDEGKELLETEQQKRELMKIEKKSQSSTSKKRTRTTLLP